MRLKSGIESSLNWFVQTSMLCKRIGARWDCSMSSRVHTLDSRPMPRALIHERGLAICVIVMST